MQIHLVVTSPFGGHAAGELITDPELVEQLLHSHADRVVRFVAPKAVTKED